MRSSFILGTALIGFVCLVPIAKDAAFAKDCATGLLTAGHERCAFTREDGGTFTLCAEFHSIITPGFQPGDFVMTFSASGAEFLCACQASGSSVSPRFRHSSSFICSENASDSVNDVLSGKASGPRVRSGQYLMGTATPPAGGTLVFSCQPDATC